MMISIRRSLSDLVGTDYIDAVCKASAAVGLGDYAALRAIADQQVEFFPEEFARQAERLSLRSGEKICPGLENSIDGAPTDAFRKAFHRESAPLSGYGPVRIGENGQIALVNPNYNIALQKIQVCDFEDKTKISGIGNAKYLPIYGQNPGLYTKADGTYDLQQGMVEMSNANTINEMLNTINVSRGYESMSTILKTQSSTLQQAISLGNISR